MEFMHTTLDNGLVIVGERNEEAQSMACAYYVKAGPIDETPEECGVSHFLEHMMFKGSDRRSNDDLNREFKEIGAIHSAFTSREHTVYWGSALPNTSPASSIFGPT